MTLSDFLRELLYPARTAPVLLTMVALLVLVAAISLTVFLSPWVALALLVFAAFGLLPGLSRYLLQLAEARAGGRDVEPPDAEMFSLLGNWWSLFPLHLLVAATAGYLWIARSGPGLAHILYVGLLVCLLPAIIAVLVITHSVVQGVNPLAWFRLILKVGPGYSFTVLAAVLMVSLPVVLSEIAPIAAIVLGTYMPFAFFAVVGKVLHAPRLIDDIELPQAAEQPAEERAAGLAKQRTNVLNHAYGFISRGNRAGGLDHILGSIQRDPDPASAWPWFFEQMLAWERNEEALHFAQHYLKRLLLDEDRIAAVKVMMRCRLVNGLFKPFEEDIERAIDAARACGNRELVSLLESSSRR